MRTPIEIEAVIKKYDGDDGTPNYIAGEAMDAVRYLNQENDDEDII